jgi:2,3-bisphosphoglycerate-dependent phosphoglycerate mutase
MITNIYFVRHANSTYTPDELKRPLSEKGQKDAEQITKLLSEENITHVISSPYQRAIQTVEGTANLFGLNILTDEGFKERTLAEGSVDNFDEVIKKYWENLNFSLSGGESGCLAQDRGVKSLKSILDKYCGGNIVIGTHGNIMVLIMNYFDKKYNYNFWRSLSMPDIYKLVFQKGNLVEVKHICIKRRE